jgi:hypothetical protein
MTDEAEARSLSTAASFDRGVHQRKEEAWSWGTG